MVQHSPVHFARAGPKGAPKVFIFAMVCTETAGIKKAKQTPFFLTFITDTKGGYSARKRRTIGCRRTALFDSLARFRCQVSRAGLAKCMPQTTALFAC